MRITTWAAMLGVVVTGAGCSDFLTAISGRDRSRPSRCPTDPGLVVPDLNVPPSTSISGAGQFPVAIRLRQRVAVVFRGRGGHIEVDGRLDVAVSDDQGLTWPLRSVAAEGQQD